MKLLLKTIFIYSPLVSIQRNLNIEFMDTLFFPRGGQNSSGILCMCIVSQHVGISAAFYEHLVLSQILQSVFYKTVKQSWEAPDCRWALRSPSQAQ